MITNATAEENEGKVKHLIKHILNADSIVHVQQLGKWYVLQVECFKLNGCRPAVFLTTEMQRKENAMVAPYYDTSDMPCYGSDEEEEEEEEESEAKVDKFGNIIEEDDIDAEAETS